MERVRSRGVRRGIARPEHHGPEDGHAGVLSGRSGHVAQVQGECHAVIRPPGLLLRLVVVVRRQRDVQHRGAAPRTYHPVGGFEIGRAVQAAEGEEVAGCEGEGVGVLVAVEEEGGGEG